MNPMIVRAILGLSGDILERRWISCDYKHVDALLNINVAA